MSDGSLVRASGLWIKDGKNGKFMSGDLKDAIPAGAKLLIFKNDRKETPAQPDYTLSYSVPDGEGGATRATSPEAGDDWGW